jgi:hypothetical protein
MTTPMEIRTRLVQNGFTPIPVAGKAAVLPEWQKRTVTSPDDLEIWDKTFPDAKNTGYLCPYVPTFDIDITR